MANDVVTFDNDNLSIVNRDDGKVSIEIHDKENLLVGILTVTADTAVALGQILTNKGSALQAQLAAGVEVEPEPEPPAPTRRRSTPARKSPRKPAARGRK